MEFNVSLEQFEGPLDLMLHLISKHKLDLFDLDLLELAKQYTAYIFESLHLGLDVASEYMVEFAGLLEYKSRKLLPRNQEELEEGYEENPAEHLAERLQAYQKAKLAAAALKELEEQAALMQSRNADSHIEEWMKIRVSKEDYRGTPNQLFAAMQKVLRRKAVLEPFATSVEVKEISTESVMKDLEASPLLEKQSISLESLLDRAQSLRELVVTFLAVLELIHQSRLYLMYRKEEPWITLIR